MFWHYVDTLLSPAFVLIACLHNIFSTWNMTRLLDAMFSLPLPNYGQNSLCHEAVLG